MPILAYNLDLDLWERLPIAVSSAVETLGLCFVNCSQPRILWTASGQYIFTRSAALYHARCHMVQSSSRPILMSPTFIFIRMMIGSASVPGVPGSLCIHMFSCNDIYWFAVLPLYIFLAVYATASMSRQVTRVDEDHAVHIIHALGATNHAAR